MRLPSCAACEHEEIPLCRFRRRIHYTPAPCTIVRLLNSCAAGTMSLRVLFSKDRRGDRRQVNRDLFFPQQTNGECPMASKSPRWSLAGLFRVGKKRPAKSPAHAKTSHPYHAVSILPGLDACAAVHRFTRQRFLSSQAPKLPLPSCDAERCTCRFKHHKDRRAGPRRRSEVGIMQAHWNGPERRRTGGRRSTDR